MKRASLTKRRSPAEDSPLSVRRHLPFYRHTPDASGGKWDLIRVFREFDGRGADLTETLLDRLNQWAARDGELRRLRLMPTKRRRLPREILLLDGSPSRLPLTLETERIASAYLAARGLSIPTRVINRREELLACVALAPRETLVLSQAAQRTLFDTKLAEALADLGAVAVPGALTAPGGPLSNKKSTYELLNGGPGWASNPAAQDRLTARYETLARHEDQPQCLAKFILDAVQRLADDWGTRTFFVKPEEGGGGRGCFRLDVLSKGFFLPDLSRLGVADKRVIAVPLPLLPDNRSHLRALAWVANRFAGSPATARAYLRSSHLGPNVRRPAGLAQLSRLLSQGTPLLLEKMCQAAKGRSDTLRRLTRAIGRYQQLFSAPYQPLICEWIDFGLFSVRAHLRLGQSGPVLESLYARLFPVEFNDEMLGVIGVDSITNRVHGGMELNRYAPLAPALVASVGGSDVLCQRIQGAFRAFARFVSLLPPEERKRLPVRAEFDLSPLNGLVAEGNADPVRAQCANTRWGRFVADCEAWVEDALAYYAWKTRDN